ncbi:MAG TPA: sulfite oxidase-like oxidoreductase [Pyrinomonadaceae bacterium]|jgi:DMSO/TMAO reductase YedYZ molybdopterin-dependent catalytic subunit|nr:sulfite oxidase-like oxidoreductase [Pyrinomonadaceae bacterium]
MSFLGNLFNDSLYQKDEPRKPEDVRETDVIISPDTRRANRVPPGQTRTRKWPVLDAHGTPDIDLATWQFEVDGLVEHPQKWSLDEFMQLPAVKVYADFHCVTRWSRLDNVWGGVSTREFTKVVGLKPEAKFVVAFGYDYGWTTNLPIEYFLNEDSLFAWSHDGQPIPPAHGGPVRLIVPQLYAWKSAKWVKGVRFLETDEPGFWEKGGYHLRGNPWNGGDGERFRWQD